MMSDAPEPPRTLAGTLPVRLAPRVSYGPVQRSASGRATNRASTSSLWRHTGGHLLLKRRRLGMSLCLARRARGPIPGLEARFCTYVLVRLPALNPAGGARLWRNNAGVRVF
jgi:hypothetical protein